MFDMPTLTYKTLSTGETVARFAHETGSVFEVVSYNWMKSRFVISRCVATYMYGCVDADKTAELAILSAELDLASGAISENDPYGETDTPQPVWAKEHVTATTTDAEIDLLVGSLEAEAASLGYDFNPEYAQVVTNYRDRLRY